MADRSTRTHLEAVLLAQRPYGVRQRKTRANSRPARPKPNPRPSKVLVVPARRSQPPRWAWLVIALLAAAMIIVYAAHTAVAEPKRLGPQTSPRVDHSRISSEGVERWTVPTLDLR